MACEHVRENATPNKPDPVSCLKCGRYMAPEPPDRLPQLEGQFLGLVAETVAALHKVDASACLEMVRERLDWGGVEYAGQWRYRDNAHEGTQESADGVAYSLFDWLLAHEFEADGMDQDTADGARMELLASAVKFVEADHHLRRARWLLRRGWVPRQAE